MESGGSSPDGQPALEGGWPQSIAEFEAVVEAFQDPLVHFAFCRLGNVPDAEDVVQEILVRAFADRARHRSVTRVGPYLYRMVLNRCTDVIRKRNWTERPSPDPETVANPADRAAPFELAAAAGRQRRIHELLARLPQREAEVIRLRVFAELPFDRIAEVMRCPVPTAKSRFRDGIGRLRKLVGKGGEI